MTIATPDIAKLAASPDEVLARLFTSMNVDGVYGRTGAYEDVVEGLGRYIGTLRPKGAEVFRFPPVVSRTLIEKSGYLKSFPHLLGCVCALGTDAKRVNEAVARFEAGGAWADSAQPSELVLAPAACYPIYPIAAQRGAIGDTLLFDVASDCFRREPSKDIDRLQSFRMREFVAIGAPEQISAFRDQWMARAPEIAGDLGLSHTIDAASDPFFGREGQMVGRFQVANALKFEMLIPVRSAESATACMSFNCHRDHFGEVWGMKTADGELAHTACVAFGIDRLAVALFARHGVEVAGWPAAVRGKLGV
ncbi:MAG: amino acid--[acyl-carrier-protein] ligase [Pseudomonadota bacterium]|nr:amino acid--[acyl-carrier-protein] ligase [Pseudomonadota bacterium]